MTIRLRETRSTNWVGALPFVQCAKNQRLHSGIGRSPFEALFGQKMKNGIVDELTIPVDEHDEYDEPEYDDVLDEGIPFKKIDGSNIFSDEYLVGDVGVSNNENEQVFSFRLINITPTINVHYFSI